MTKQHPEVKWYETTVSCGRCSGPGDYNCPKCHGTDRVPYRAPIKPKHWDSERWADYLDVTR